MKRQLIVVMAGAILFFISESASAQSDTPRVEIGAQYTFLDLSSIPSRDFFIIQSSGGRHGFGGRVVFNASDYVSLEAELNFFPNGEYIRSSGEGSSTQALFGIKVGKRGRKAGLFGKIRPGFVYFSKVPDCPGENASSCTVTQRTLFAADLGGVFEYYASRRVALRVDFGETIIRHHDFKVVDVRVTVSPQHQ